MERKHNIAQLWCFSFVFHEPRGFWGFFFHRPVPTKMKQLTQWFRCFDPHFFRFHSPAPHSIGAWGPKGLRECLGWRTKKWHGEICLWCWHIFCEFCFLMFVIVWWQILTFWCWNNLTVETWLPRVVIQSWSYIEFYRCLEDLDTVYTLSTEWLKNSWSKFLLERQLEALQMAATLSSIRGETDFGRSHLDSAGWL